MRRFWKRRSEQVSAAPGRHDRAAVGAWADLGVLTTVSRREVVLGVPQRRAEVGVVRARVGTARPARATVRRTIGVLDVAALARRPPAGAVDGGAPTRRVSEVPERGWDDRTFVSELPVVPPAALTGGPPRAVAFDQPAAEPPSAPATATPSVGAAASAPPRSAPAARPPRLGLGAPMRPGRPIAEQVDERPGDRRDAHVEEQPDAQAVSEVVAEVARARGASIADVRVERGPAADDAVARHDAVAVTLDGVIHLPSSHGPLSRPEARGLLAHEVVHVAQQRSVRVLPPERSPEGLAMERDARAVERSVRGDQQALAVARVRPVDGRPTTTTGGQVQRAREIAPDVLISQEEPPRSRQRAPGDARRSIEPDRWSAGVASDPYAWQDDVDATQPLWQAGEGFASSFEETIASFTNLDLGPQRREREREHAAEREGRSRVELHQVRRERFEELREERLAVRARQQQLDPTVSTVLSSAEVRELVHQVDRELPLHDYSDDPLSDEVRAASDAIDAVPPSAPDGSVITGAPPDHHVPSDAPFGIASHPHGLASHPHGAAAPVLGGIAGDQALRQHEPPAAPAAAPQPSFDARELAPHEVEALVQRLWDRLRTKLRGELLVDRERAGLLADRF